MSFSLREYERLEDDVTMARGVVCIFARELIAATAEADRRHVLELIAACLKDVDKAEKALGDYLEPPGGVPMLTTPPRCRW